MRVTRTLAAAACGTAALVGLAAAPAQAAPSIFSSPATVKLGGTLTILVEGCEAGGFWLGGGQFGETSARASLVRDGARLRGTLTVPKKGTGVHAGSLAPGPSQVWVKCGDADAISKPITILPAGAPETGGGATSHGMDMTLAAGGAGALALSGAGALVLLRRRRATGDEA
ncbi:hypothetical protein [Longispora albida]|uniref:hypothetical protein n=1 Tax=Longispora albida TaxID=203523 RepID=UPI00037C94A3|nr:hypothetical protein [Longispora albida]